MYDVLSQDIMYLHGVGPKRVKIFNKDLEIFSLRDLLYYFPHKYIDRSRIYRINELEENMAAIQIIGQIKLLTEVGIGRRKRLEAIFDDGTGVIRLVWFGGINYIKRQLKLNMDYLVFGRPSVFNHEINCALSIV